MPIYDQTFRRYEGARRTGGLWWPVARQTMVPTFKNKLGKLLWLGVLGNALFFSVILFIGSTLEQNLRPEQMEAVGQAAQAQRIPLFGRNVRINSVLYMFVGSQVTLIAMLILASGGGAVASDLRHSALPLYFSRPLRPMNYILGKVLGLATAPILVVCSSILLIYIQVIAYYRPLVDLLKELPMLLAGVGFVVGTSLILSLFMVAISSACRKPATASVLFMGFFLSTGVVSEIVVSAARNRRFAVIAPGFDFRVILQKMLRPDRRWSDPSQHIMRATELPLVFFALGAYCVIALLVIRRNLKVVEVVK